MVEVLKWLVLGSVQLLGWLFIVFTVGLFGKLLHDLLWHGFSQIRWSLNITVSWKGLSLKERVSGGMIILANLALIIIFLSLPWYNWDYTALPGGDYWTLVGWWWLAWVLMLGSNLLRAGEFIKDDNYEQSLRFWVSSPFWFFGAWLLSLFVSGDWGAIIQTDFSQETSTALILLGISGAILLPIVLGSSPFRKRQDFFLDNHISEDYNWLICGQVWGEWMQITLAGYLFISLILSQLNWLSQSALIISGGLGLLIFAIFELITCKRDTGFLWRYLGFVALMETLALVVWLSNFY